MTAILNRCIITVRILVFVPIASLGLYQSIARAIRHAGKPRMTCTDTVGQHSHKLNCSYVAMGPDIPSRVLMPLQAFTLSSLCSCCGFICHFALKRGKHTHFTTARPVVATWHHKRRPVTFHVIIRCMRILHARESSSRCFPFCRVTKE